MCVFADNMVQAVASDTHTHNAVEMDYIAVGRPDVCLVKQYGLAVSS